MCVWSCWVRVWRSCVPPVPNNVCTCTCVHLHTCLHGCVCMCVLAHVCRTTCDLAVAIIITTSSVGNVLGKNNKLCPHLSVYVCSIAHQFQTQVVYMQTTMDTRTHDIGVEGMVTRWALAAFAEGHWILYEPKLCNELPQITSTGVPLQSHSANCKSRRSFLHGEPSERIGPSRWAHLHGPSKAHMSTVRENSPRLATTLGRCRD